MRSGSTITQVSSLLELLFTLLPAPGDALQMDPEEMHTTWLVFPELA